MEACSVVRESVLYDIDDYLRVMFAVASRVPADYDSARVKSDLKTRVATFRSEQEAVNRDIVYCAIDLMTDAFIQNYKVHEKQPVLSKPRRWFARFVQIRRKLFQN